MSKSNKSEVEREKCKFCSRPVECRGLCTAHYWRWQKGKRGAELAAPIRDYGLGDVDLLDNSGPPVSRLNYDKEWTKFAEWLGIRAERRAKIPRKPKGKHILNGAISDSHIPFHDMDALLEAVEFFKREGCSCVYLAGDVFDHYSLSRFNQYEQVDIQHEAIDGRKVLDLLSRSFAEVILMGGNHDERERKYLSNRLPPDLLDWFLGKGFLYRMTQDMPNVSVISRKIEGETMHWLAPVGKDCIIAHAETHSKIGLRAAENVRAWLDLWHGVMQVNRPKVVMQAHTHNAGMVRAGGQLVLELGCTCKIQGYALRPNLYPKPQVQAATIFEQVDGVTQFNSIRQRFLKMK